MLVCVRGYNTDINTLKDGQKFDICSLLIERGASVEKYKKLGINNPLHWACFFGDLKTTKLLMYIEPSLSNDINQCIVLFTNDRD